MGAISKAGVSRAHLLSPDTRVEAPFVQCTIGGYTFGTWNPKAKGINVANGVVSTAAVRFPNFIQDLTITKINGKVNTYSLHIKYPITENSDPNFFEKLFSNISDTRKIVLSYGDAMQPGYVYKEEVCMITAIKNSFDIKTSVIDYTIEAVSSSILATSATCTFCARNAKPSDVIKEVLNANGRYHLLDIFSGMSRNDVQNLLIAGDDKKVQIPGQVNVSPLDYISTLISYMTPEGSSDAIKSNIYSLVVLDDTTNTYGGPYFKVQKLQSAYSVLNQLCTYDIDIGYPSANIITDFRIDQNENWSIFYNYNRSTEGSDSRMRIDDSGNVEYIYSPQLTNSGFEMKPSDSTWWTRMTEFPAKASITIKGLLKPAILMQYVKLNIWFYGHKHVASGYYVITEQKDSLGLNGYFTTLKLIRVGEDEEML